MFSDSLKWIVYVTQGGEIGPSYFAVHENHLDSIKDGFEHYHINEYIGKNYTTMHYFVKDKRVYFDNDNPYLSIPKPIYDFNKKAGEYVAGQLIDSTTYINFNGQQRLVQYLRGKLIFVEGIGCLSKGFIYFYDFGSFAGYTLYDMMRFCVGDTSYRFEGSPDDAVILNYGTPCMDSAYQKKVSTPIFTSNINIKIYPNPAFNEVSITNFTGKAAFYDVNGRCVKSLIIKNEQPIPIHDLIPGLYTIQFFNQNKVSHYKLMVSPH